MQRQPLGLAVCGCLYAVLALAACSVGTRYEKPQIATPAQWHGTAGNDAGGGNPPGAAWPDAGWWRHFGSTRLDALIAAAERSNDDLAAAVARVEEADAQARSAGAALLPAVDLDASATRERAPVSGVGPEVYNLFNPALSASYELDFWGKNRARRDSARAAASVASTYFQALELRDRIEVARQNLQNGRRILSGLQFEQSAGTATGLDVAQQETAVALLDAALPPLLEQFRQTVNALAVLVGETPESLDIDSGSLTGLTVPPVTAGLPAELLARRPDVAEAEQQLIAANADITVARGPVSQHCADRKRRL